MKWLFLKEDAIIMSVRYLKVPPVAIYHAATGLEALFGYLHLNGEKDRINELFSVIWDSFSDKI